MFSYFIYVLNSIYGCNIVAQLNHIFLVLKGTFAVLVSTGAKKHQNVKVNSSRIRTN